MYGPTVVITTFVDSASARSELSWVLSAWSTPGSAPRSLRRTSSSLSRVRPAIAPRSSGGGLDARYCAVSAPVNPVAPKTTMSYSRSVIDPPRGLERGRRLHARAGRDPARDRRRHALGGMGGLPGEVEQDAELLRAWRLGP